MTTEREDIAIAVSVLSLRKKTALVEAAVRRPLAREQLDIGVYQVLASVYDARDHKSTPTELAAATGVTTGGITRLVDHAALHGYVKREPDPDDKRGTRVGLTPHGVQRLMAGTAALAAAVREISGPQA